MEEINKEFNKAQKIVNSIEVQNSSIVSKQIIKKPNGSVTLFAFANDESLSEHTSPFDALVHIVEGNMEIRISGNSNKVSAGEILILPANLPHSLLALSNSKMLLIMIK